MTVSASPVVASLNRIRAFGIPAPLESVTRPQIKLRGHSTPVGAIAESPSPPFGQNWNPAHEADDDVVGEVGVAAGRTGTGGSVGAIDVVAAVIVWNAPSGDGSGTAVATIG